MPETVGLTPHPALTDEETGLPNRLHFDTVFEVVFAAARRGIPLTLLLVEIDDFAGWSSQAGSSRAARTLRALGMTLVGSVRTCDLVARTQENRIALALLDCELSGGGVVADRLQSLMVSFRKDTGLSVSIGGAQARSSMMHLEDLVGAAEHALRVAQSRGRNQVELVR